MAQLLNTARLDGDYNETTPMWLETTLTIEMVDISITKTANHTIWADGELTYTITVLNNDTNPITNPVLTDTIEYQSVSFVEDSVMINGTTTSDYSYDETSGVLTVVLPDLNAGESLEITFRISKA